MNDREAIEHLTNDWFESLGGQLCVDGDKVDGFLEAVGIGISALQEREERSKEGKSLREKIERYKIESGFASATPEERAMLAESLIDTLKSLDIPTIDAVPMVRCKDCKHYGNEYGHPYGGECAWHGSLVDPDDFCSYGERRTDDGT